MDQRLLVGAMIVLLIAGCTKAPSTTEPSSPEIPAQTPNAQPQPQVPQTQAPEGKTVSITATMYDPPNFVVPVGTTVTWVNNDPVNNHRVYSDGNFDSQVLSPGQSWSFTFGEVREYNIRDFIYPKIRSSIRVE